MREAPNAGLSTDTQYSYGASWPIIMLGQVVGDTNETMSYSGQQSSATLVLEKPEHVQ